MVKKIIQVPSGIKYLSDLKIKNENGEMVKFELPNGIFNKYLAGCGGTTLALEDSHKTIICSPRVELLKNKHAQYPEQTLLVIGGTTKGRIVEYLQTHETPKILVTYDSLYKLEEYVEDKSDWRVIVDEFQCILSDSAIKSETEMRFIKYVRNYPYVTFLSATPILDQFLEEIDELRHLDYYELDWEDKEQVYVDRQKHASPLNAALEIVKNFKIGNYPFRLDENGKEIYSYECVLFLNSVRTIFSIIKQSGVAPEDVNIIMGQTEENDKALERACPGFTRGRIPLKGEPHKRITFCTSTAYAGCDFYSTSASTFVVCDCKRPNTSVDISTELVQIAGRQRLVENKFRRYITVLFNTNAEFQSEEEHQREIENKVKDSNSDLSYFSTLEGKSKDRKMKEIIALQNSLKFETNYVYWCPEEQKFKFNKMAYLNDRYIYKVQCYNYQNGIMVKKLMEETGQFDVSEKQEYYDSYQEQLNLIFNKECFADSMKTYCDYRKLKEDAKGLSFCIAMTTLESRYPKLIYYYDQLGADRIKALGYKESALKNEIMAEVSKERISMMLQTTITQNHPYQANVLKEIIKECYRRNGVTKTAKFTDLEKVYGMSVQLVKVQVNGSRENRYKVIFK